MRVLTLEDLHAEVERKTLFNDTRKPAAWVTQCPGCRAETRLTVHHYPHGPNEVKFCAICGAHLEHNNIQPKGEVEA